MEEEKWGNTFKNHQGVTDLIWLMGMKKATISKSKRPTNKKPLAGLTALQGSKSNKNQFICLKHKCSFNGALQFNRSEGKNTSS